MSRRDFIELAQRVATLKGKVSEEDRKAFAEELACFLALRNPHFIRVRFIAACGF